MQGTHRIGEVIEVTYQAPGAQSGLDIRMFVFDPTKTLVEGVSPPIQMQEIGSEGEYVASFTPGTSGVWRAICRVATGGGQVIKPYFVVPHNIHSIGDDIQDMLVDLGDIDLAIAGLPDAADVNAEVDQALIDYDVATKEDVEGIDSPPMIG
jgi:hypothetical protein